MPALQWRESRGIRPGRAQALEEWIINGFLKMRKAAFRREAKVNTSSILESKEGGRQKDLAVLTTLVSYSLS